MYLDKRPTYFVKNGKRKAVYHTGLARELTSQGWKEEGIIDESPKVDPVIATEPVAEHVDIDLLEMTKTELISYAEEREISVRSNATKAEILQACLGDQSSDD
jgi:hypothetical protein